MTTKPRSRKATPPVQVAQLPQAAEPSPAAARPLLIRRIDLDPAEAAELRALQANRVMVGFQAASLRQLADGLIAVADQQIKDSAHRFAKSAGIDLTKEAGGRWHIDAERGCIEEVPPEQQPASPAPADAKEP